MSRIIVTSALPYTNGPLHIGHIAGCYLPADIYVRYQKLKSQDIIHICGTDDHGTPITIRAIEENTTPKKIADKYYTIIKNSLEKLGIIHENFSRTESEKHYKNTQDFFTTLYKKELLTPEMSDQMFCGNCSKFLPDRFIEGICPHCANNARGDQCEHCGRWLEPTMLVEPTCKICKNTPKLRTTKQWYLRLDLLQPQIEDWVNTTKWKENVIPFVKNWLKEGLKPRPVTRDMEWGVPVPLGEAQGKVIYVWFEALIGYISSTIEWNKNRWQEYWKARDTKLIHFIGKDNIVFHAIVWPGMLIGQGEFIMPHFIAANEFLNIEGKKISASRNWAVWVPDYLDNFEPDSLRYVLTMNAPEKGDVDFTWDDFLAKNNDELSDILGNFVHRTLTFIIKHLNSKIPYPDIYTAEDEEMVKKIELTRTEVGMAIENFEFKKALKKIMALTRDGNRYFDYNKPWEMNDRTHTVIYVCTTIIANLSVLLYPFLPFTAQSIIEMLGFDLPLMWDNKITLPKGAYINPPKILFKKIQKEKIEKEKQKLRGTLSLTSPLTPNETKTITFDEFKKLDLRIAQILEAHKIEGTKKLIKLTISIGEEKRQIVAGIGEAYSSQDLVGKKIVVLTNLEPRTIHNALSEGMLLAATDKDKVVLLIPDQDISSGSIVS